MSRGDPTGDPLRRLFDQGRDTGRVSDVTRARALARARAWAATASSTNPSPAIPRRAPRRGIAILSAAAAFVLLTIGAAVAFRGHFSRESPVPVKANGRRWSPAAPEAAAPSVDLEPSTVVDWRQPRGRARASLADELALIQRAQSAYADGNCRAVLQLVAEHRRAFPNGRIAEEREALGVRSLALCGRPTDARRALGVFARRFPHSILLPPLQRAVADGRPAPATQD
jgi:hypothetical protein